MEVATNSLTKSTKLCRKPPQPQPWADLRTELLEIIISKLPIFDIPLFKFVCSSWCRNAITCLSSPLSLYHSQSPLLILHQENNSFGKNTVFFYSLKNKSICQYRNLPMQLHESSCVGSSHEFLVILDRLSNPYLLHLISRSLIKLPPLQCNNFGLSPCISLCIGDSRKPAVIEKAVLSDNNVVIILNGRRTNLSYWRRSGDAWNYLYGQKEQLYADILCSKNKLHASHYDNSIGVWDFNGGDHPVKVADIRPSLDPTTCFSRSFFTTHHYLVESCGDVLFVVSAIHPLCPDSTLDFKVYKLDFESEKWPVLGSLGGRALLLGGNHSVSLSIEEHREFKGNSIYFTDNYWKQNDRNWKRNDRNYWYEGDDTGVYSMEDGSINPFLEVDDMKIEPPLFPFVHCTWF